MRVKIVKNKMLTLKFRAVNRDIFEAIKNGSKKVETRAATTKYRNIEAGDSVILVCGKDRFLKYVMKAEFFKTVKALLKKYKVEEVNQSVGSAEELLGVYYSFPGYKEKIRKHGLIALELK